MNTPESPQIAADRRLIQRLGGPSKVARMLNYGPNGAQRVHNWLTRGIPPRVKLEHPRIFLKRRGAGG